MGDVQKNADATSEKNRADLSLKTVARIEEIYQAVLRIEGALKRPMGDGEGKAGADAAVTTAVGGTVERLSLTLTEIRNLQYKAAGILSAVREDVREILAARPNDFVDGLGPKGLR
ncbi:MAG: hypothetical protein JW765_11490 [Deltaproteobacteria bacterium]|nr:hypothetical protein [Candidatus Zymogenaceae bacterium]